MAKSLAAFVAAFSLSLCASAWADCTGDCGTELLDTPVNVEKYVKAAWKALARCAETGEPTCPQACALPDGTADPYLLGASCAGLIGCELQTMAADAYTTSWDGGMGCALAAATTCGDARGGAAGKFVSAKLKRR